MIVPECFFFVCSWINKKWTFMNSQTHVCSWMFTFCIFMNIRFLCIRKYKIDAHLWTFIPLFFLFTLYTVLYHPLYSFQFILWGVPRGWNQWSEKTELCCYIDTINFHKLGTIFHEFPNKLYMWRNFLTPAQRGRIVLTLCQRGPGFFSSPFRRGSLYFLPLVIYFSPLVIYFSANDFFA